MFYVDLLDKEYFLNRNPKILEIFSNGSVSTQLYQPTCYNMLTNMSQSILYSDVSSFYTDIFLSTSIKNPSISTQTGQTVELDCQQYSIPSSDLWWTFNDRVLSKTASPDSPYEFLENFNQTLNPFNKSSILRIKNIQEKLAGTYMCKAFYFNVDLNQFNNISGLKFQVNVAPGVLINKGVLTEGQIAGIVIGSILGFLLLCLLAFLLVWCCCFRRRLCCFGSRKDNTSTSSSSIIAAKSGVHTNTLNSRKYLTQSSLNSFENSRALTEIDETASGFHDLSNSKPNYVVNTISRSLGRAELSKESNLTPRANLDSETFVYNVKNQNAKSAFENGYNLNECGGLNSNRSEGNSRNFNSVNQGYLNEYVGGGEGLNSNRSESNSVKYIETMEYSSNRYLQSGCPIAQGEFMNENFYNQVIIEDGLNKKNCLQKYDSDV